MLKQGRGENWKGALRVAGLFVPTLVFTLVLTQILYDRRLIGDTVAGALIVYTIGNSLMMPLLFGLPLFNLNFGDWHRARHPEA